MQRSLAIEAASGITPSRGFESATRLNLDASQKGITRAKRVLPPHGGLNPTTLDETGKMVQSITPSRGFESLN